jgi:hypothetical protein
MTARLFPSEQLTFATARIECRLADGKSSVGTGFFFNFPRPLSQIVPVIVTNNHVVRNSVSCHFRFTARDSSGNPNCRDSIQFDLVLPESNWIKHPDPTVDLALLPIAPLLSQMQQQGKLPFYVSLDPNLIPDAAAIGELGAVEDVLMIGYPNGLWDSVTVDVDDVLAEIICQLDDVERWPRWYHSAIVASARRWRPPSFDVT